QRFRRTLGGTEVIGLRAFERKIRNRELEIWNDLGRVDRVLRRAVCFDRDLLRRLEVELHVAIRANQIEVVQGAEEPDLGKTYVLPVRRHRRGCVDRGDGGVRGVDRRVGALPHAHYASAAFRWSELSRVIVEEPGAAR